MPDEEVSARLQIVVKLIDQRFLRRMVEIDHDVAAKHDIERTLDRESIVHQVQASELNHVRQVGLHF